MAQHPLYAYGVPVVVVGSGTPANTTGQVENGGSDGTPHTPPSNVGTIIVPGGSPSWEVEQANTPAITSLVPNTLPDGYPVTTMTVNGANFRSGSTLTINGSALPATFVSQNVLTIVITQGATAGQYAVQVTNPSSLTSNTSSFTVEAPPPPEG